MAQAALKAFKLEACTWHGPSGESGRLPPRRRRKLARWRWRGPPGNGGICRPASTRLEALQGARTARTVKARATLQEPQAGGAALGAGRQEKEGAGPPAGTSDHLQIGGAGRTAGR